MKTERIRALNDAFRRRMPSRKVFASNGVMALDTRIKREVERRIRSFTRFNAVNDPTGERKSGPFKLKGYVFFFRIEYYDRDNWMRKSCDPSVVPWTHRVMFIRLASER